MGTPGCTHAGTPLGVDKHPPDRPCDLASVAPVHHYSAFGRNSFGRAAGATCNHRHTARLGFEVHNAEALNVETV